MEGVQVHEDHPFLSDNITTCFVHFCPSRGSYKDFFFPSMDASMGSLEFPSDSNACDLEKGFYPSSWGNPHCACVVGSSVWVLSILFPPFIFPLKNKGPLQIG